MHTIQEGATHKLKPSSFPELPCNLNHRPWCLYSYLWNLGCDTKQKDVSQKALKIEALCTTTIKYSKSNHLQPEKIETGSANELEVAKDKADEEI